MLPEHIVATTAERLKSAMEYRHTTAAEISRATGISRGSLSQYISGKFSPKQDRIYILAKHLRVSPMWLMGLDVPMEEKVDRVPTDEGSEKDSNEFELFKCLMRRNDDLGKAFRTFACAIVKKYTSEEPDSELLNKFHALTEEHQAMIEAMINAFYLTDKQKSPRLRSWASQKK